MSFRNCILDRLDNKYITKGEASKLLKEYDDLQLKYADSMGDEQAAAAAAAKILTAKIENLKTKKHRKIQAAISQMRVRKDIEDRMAANGTTVDLEVRDLYERAYVRGLSTFRRASEHLGEFIEKHRAKWAGLTQNHEAMPDVVRAIVGEKSANADANLFGEQIRQAFETLHKSFKAAGGVIGHLDNYFPQVHTAALLRKVDPEDWVRYMLDRVDRTRMVNRETGLPFTDAELIPIMRADYDDITSGGRTALQQRVDRGLQTFGFGKDIDYRRDSSRFYHFKDADAFLEYNERFGVGATGLFNTIIGYMHAMSRDIGVLETLGSAPNAISRHLDLKMQAGKTGKVKKAWTNSMYDVLVGRTHGNGDEPTWSRVLGNTQDLMRAAYLGSAPLAALSDTTFGVLTARQNGLSSTRLLGEFMRQMNPVNPVHRRMMARAGYAAESASGASIAAARFTDDLTGKGTSRWLATFTNTASGLHAMTQGIKDAVTVELHGTLAEFMHTRIAWSELPDVFRNAAAGHGITEDMWKIFQKADLQEVPGVGTFLRPQEVALAKGVSPKDAIAASNALDDWTTSLRLTVANEPALRTRAITTGAIAGDAEPGTLNRALFSSAMMFKGFPVTVIFNHVLGAFKDAKQGRLSQLAILIAGTTTMGAVATQMLDMLKGKDPREMDNPKFWMAAMAKGGGLGMAGDLLFSDYTRFGSSPVTDMVTGPVIGLAADVGRIGIGTFQKALEDDTYEALDKFRADTFKLAKQHIPAGSLWYSRLVLERMLLDTLEEAVDPNYNKNVRNMEKRMRRDYGQRFWWAPGEMSPDRAPDLENTNLGEILQ